MNEFSPKICIKNIVYYFVNNNGVDGYDIRDTPADS